MKKKIKKKFRISKKLRDAIHEAAIHKETANNFEIDKSSLVHLYWHVGLSQKQIGNIFGVASQCVSHKMHDFDISIRKGRRSKPKSTSKCVNLSSPNTYEQKIIDLCAKMHYPFTFVGNRYKVIGDKSPDFIDNDGSKCIIEVYAKHWHEDNYEDVRGDFFGKRGYEILFLSDNDLNNMDWEEICILKIDRFLERNTI